MITTDALRKLALSFPEATEEPHFEKSSFRVKKRIFATVDEKGKTATLKLSENDQEIFSSAVPDAIYPVNNKWGKQGWTLIELERVDEELFAEMLVAAYCQVAPKKLVDQIRPMDFE